MIPCLRCAPAERPPKTREGRAGALTAAAPDKRGRGRVWKGAAMAFRRFRALVSRLLFEDATYRGGRGLAVAVDSAFVLLALAALALAR